MRKFSQSVFASETSVLSQLQLSGNKTAVWNVTYRQVVKDYFTTESSCTFGAQFPSNENALAGDHISADWL
jgi:hypothetical protein